MIFHRDPIRRLTALPSSILVRNVFTTQECQNIIDKTTKLIEPQLGKTFGDTTDEKVRNGNVRWISCTPETKWIFDKIDFTLNEVNCEWFNFDLVGYNQIQFTEYQDSNQRYSWHTDMGWAEKDIVLSPEIHLRKLSCSILLNQQEIDFEGGNFEFDNMSKPKNIELDAGDAVVFPSFAWHQITPVTKGTRYSLVVWVVGPPFK